MIESLSIGDKSCSVWQELSYAKKIKQIRQLVPEIYPLEWLGPMSGSKSGSRIKNVLMLNSSAKYKYSFTKGIRKILIKNYAVIFMIS